MSGFIKEILIAHKAGAELFEIDVAELVLDKGISGDRYFKTMGTFSEKLKESKDFEVTLIEQEEIDTFNQATQLNYPNNKFRRNIITTDINLPELIGKEFNIGSTRLKGIRFCEPCAYLSKLLGKEIMSHMMHKSGIRAAIISDGLIRKGDPIHQC